LPRDGRKTPGLPGDDSEMDVSRVDPEEVLVDFENVEPGDGDMSADIDESLLRDLDQGKDDKVLVSVRYDMLISIIENPADAPAAFDLLMYPLHGHISPTRDPQVSSFSPSTRDPHFLKISTSMRFLPGPLTNQFTRKSRDPMSALLWTASTPSYLLTVKLRLVKRSPSVGM
jgi:hypothetical protein